MLRIGKSTKSSQVSQRDKGSSTIAEMQVHQSWWKCPAPNIHNEGEDIVNSYRKSISSLTDGLRVANSIE